MSEVEVTLSETPAEQQVMELYAWIATHRNGGEGIVACFLPGLGVAPMLSSDRAIMEQAEPLVHKTIAATRGRGPADEAVAVRLVTFRRVIDG